MRRIPIIRMAILALAVCICAVPVDGQAAESRKVVERLYFGRDAGGGRTVSAREWERFVAEVAAPRVPGLTAWEAHGAWREDSGATTREPTFVMEVMHAPGDGVSAQLDTVAWEYAARFGQQSVLRTTGAVRMHEYRRGERTPAPEPAPVFLTPPGDWPYPFSPAVRAGGLIFVSGQIGSRREADGRLVVVPGGIEAETRQTLDNVREILERAGSSMERVVKCTVMMADMAEWPAMNAIYATYFPGPKPARSAFGATALALGARVEIECIAADG